VRIILLSGAGVGVALLGMLNGRTVTENFMRALLYASPKQEQ
jgi:hypothetical protein